MVASFCHRFHLLVFNDGPTVQGVEFWGGKEMPFMGLLFLTQVYQMMSCLRLFYSLLLQQDIAPVCLF